MRVNVNSIVIFALRISLGIIFFWFGALKIAGYNPVYDLVYAVIPYFADGTGNLILGTFEALVGAGLLFNLLPKLTHVVLLLHLLATFVVFITAPQLMFNPHFPILTLAGEFVVKNITLAAAGLAVLRFQKR
jgi:putative oxidoreductase